MNRRSSQAVGGSAWKTPILGKVVKIAHYRIGNLILDDVDVLPSADEVRRDLANPGMLATDPGDIPPFPLTTAGTSTGDPSTHRIVRRFDGVRRDLRDLRTTLPPASY